MVIITDLIIEKQMPSVFQSTDHYWLKPLLPGIQVS